LLNSENKEYLETIRQCRKCHSPHIELDYGHLIDARRFGILEYVPLMYRCIICGASTYSFTPDPIPDKVEESLCETCGDRLAAGRRRYCSPACARPTRSHLAKIGIKNKR
jgi:hypothetical protein